MLTLINNNIGAFERRQCADHGRRSASRDVRRGCDEQRGPRSGCRRRPAHMRDDVTAVGFANRSALPTAHHSTQRLGCGRSALTTAFGTSSCDSAGGTGLGSS